MLYTILKSFLNEIDQQTMLEILIPIQLEFIRYLIYANM